MDILQPFCRDIPGFEYAAYTGGTKFRNGDTIMARITPCLENGKISKVNILDDGEIGFGSTEYIVFRAKKGIVDEDFLYYLVCSPIVREPAIKSMVGSSGRQRVQTDVVQNLEVDIPDFATQRKIGQLLKSLDDKIALNTAINENLAVQRSRSETSSSPDMRRGNRASLIVEMCIFSLILLCIDSIIGVINDITDRESSSVSTKIFSLSKSRVTIASKTAPEALFFNDTIALSA